MVQAIKVHELAELLVKKLESVTHLKSVSVGIESGNLEEWVMPDKIPIASGQNEIIKKGMSTIISNINNKCGYTVRQDPNCKKEGNILYIRLEIDTNNGYSINNLDDDDLFDEPFTLL
jgi:hypothetical protein